jgi:hypothetical protein
MNGLRLDDRAAAMKGGYSGAVIVAGSSGTSKLMERVTSSKEGLRMPPAGPTLTAAEIAALRGWIDAGAAWPESAAPKPVKAGVARPKPWSFAPLKRPTGANIDEFILARLRAEKIEPSPEAPKSTLLRRVSLDLTGLPPTPAELQAFLADASPNAYERAVDRLLDSPITASAGPVNGSTSLATPTPTVTKRIFRAPGRGAGVNGSSKHSTQTCRSTASPRCSSPETCCRTHTAEDRVATGFHRNTLRNREGGVKLEQTFFEETIDRANTVGTVWWVSRSAARNATIISTTPFRRRITTPCTRFFDNVEEEFVDAPMPGELAPYSAKRDEYLTKRQALLEEYGVTRLMSPWEEKVRWAAKNVGKLTDWDITYDVIFQMSDGGHKFTSGLIATSALGGSSRYWRIISSSGITSSFRRTSGSSSASKNCRRNSGLCMNPIRNSVRRK